MGEWEGGGEEGRVERRGKDEGGGEWRRGGKEVGGR